MLWALQSSMPGRHFSVLFSFAVTPRAGAVLSVTLTIADLVTAPPVELDSQKGREFRGLMERATALLGARAVPEASGYAFRIEERHNDHIFAVAFSAGVGDEQREVIIERTQADELGRLLEAAVGLLVAADDHRCASPNAII